MDIVGSCSPLEGDVGPRADKLNRARKGPVFSRARSLQAGIPRDQEFHMPMPRRLGESHT
jgi:hypothetical protein